jgi:hypothetical protein
MGPKELGTMSPQHDSQHEFASSGLAVPQIKSKTFDRKRLIPSVYIGQMVHPQPFPRRKSWLAADASENPAN